MACDDDLHLREVARWKALWALADLASGDPRAADALGYLDDIDHQEQRRPHTGACPGHRKSWWYLDCA